jgi:nucleoside-diphosphate-sugar epimerase
LPQTVVRKWIEAAQRGGPLQVFGSGSRTQDFVSTTDVATAVWQALVAPDARGICHIGCGVPLAMRDVAQLIAGFRNTPIVFGGDDPGEHDRWNLSLVRARTGLGYTPSQTGEQAIETLARQVL